MALHISASPTNRICNAVSSTACLSSARLRDLLGQVEGR